MGAVTIRTVRGMCRRPGASRSVELEFIREMHSSRALQGVVHTRSGEEVERSTRELCDARQQEIPSQNTTLDQPYARETAHLWSEPL